MEPQHNAGGRRHPIGRRDLIATLGGAVAAWPLIARGEQRTMPLVGFLSPASPNDAIAASFVAGFRQGLNETGFVDGQNVTIEYRWASGKYDHLAALAAEFVQAQAAVIVASGPPPALAAKAATTKIPIVFSSGDDPVKLGLVASLNRPGGNATGVIPITSALAGKRLALLHEMVPSASAIAVIMNPHNVSTGSQLNDLKGAGQTLGLQLQVMNASSEGDFDIAFDTFVRQRTGALLVAADVFLTNSNDRLVALSARYALPAMYLLRWSVEGGGLMSYGPSFADNYRQVGIYTGRILKGEKPAEMPVKQATKFDLVINVKTAKALGLSVPPTLLARADEVIE